MTHVDVLSRAVGGVKVRLAARLASAGNDIDRSLRSAAAVISEQLVSVRQQRKVVPLPREISRSATSPRPRNDDGGWGHASQPACPLARARLSRQPVRGNSILLAISLDNSPRLISRITRQQPPTGEITVPVSFVAGPSTLTNEPMEFSWLWELLRLRIS